MHPLYALMPSAMLSSYPNSCIKSSGLLLLKKQLASRITHPKTSSSVGLLPLLATLFQKEKTAPQAAVFPPHSPPPDSPLPSIHTVHDGT